MGYSRRCAAAVSPTIASVSAPWITWSRARPAPALEAVARSDGTPVKFTPRRSGEIGVTANAEPGDKTAAVASCAHTQPTASNPRPNLDTCRIPDGGALC